jgi:pimeloyl-ACP methyl ester carboxylesterase
MPTPDPLVLLPGLLNDDDLWADQIAALSGTVTCQVGVITQGETLPEIAHSALTAAPRHFALAGFSLGGYVAQEILRVAPERVTRLALLDTSIRPDPPERTALRRKLERAATAPGKFHGFGEHLLATYLDPTNHANDAVVARIRAMTERLGAEVFVRQNRLPRADGEAALRAFDRPTLILCGENDALTPRADHEEMARIAPAARLVVLPGCGHMTTLEAPGAVTDALRGWLSA